MTPQEIATRSMQEAFNKYAEIEAERNELLRKAKSVGLIYSPKPKKQDKPLQIGSYKYKAR